MREDRVTTSREPEMSAGAGGPRSTVVLPREKKFHIAPYKARAGETYMNASQLAYFRSRLEHWRRELIAEAQRTMDHLRDDAAHYADLSDRASQASDFELELRTRDRERKLLRKIEQALQRIEDGSYGYCDETGEEIGLRRLEARPIATFCLEAQERRERNQRVHQEE